MASNISKGVNVSLAILTPSPNVVVSMLLYFFCILYCMLIGNM